MFGPNDPIAFEMLASVFFALGTGAILAGVLWLSSGEKPGGFWMIGWAALLLTGGFYSGEASGWEGASVLAMMMDGLFAPLMWLGCVSLVRGGSPAPWPVIIGFAAGLLRVLASTQSLDALATLLAVTLAPGFFAASAYVMWRTPEHVRFGRTIAAFFAVLSAIELADAYLDATRPGNTVAYGLFAVVGMPLAAIQVTSRVDALRRGMATAQAASDAAERRRDLERSHFHALFDAMKELVAELEPDTRIIFVNRRARDLLGLEVDDLIGTHALDYVDAEHRFEAEELWRAQAKSGGLDRPVTFGVPRKDGSGEVFLEINVSERVFEGQRRYLVLARDVTGRHESEERLEARQHALEARIARSREELRASRLRLEDRERLAVVGTLASGIAHQINNPLGAILAAADFALLEPDDGRREGVMREALSRIAAESRRAGRIVKSTLRFARHGATPKWLDDLGPVVRRSAELCRDYVRERGGELEIAVAQEELPILMSPIEIEQLVVNLVHNAAESRRGGARVRVEVDGNDGGRHARIRVHDDGQGIDAAALKEVFDPFYTTRIHDGGSGLGLSVAHGIVEDHGGAISIDSEPRRGTTVTIELPLRKRE